MAPKAESWTRVIFLAAGLAWAANGTAGGPGDESRRWFNWSVHLAPFPSTSRYKDSKILKRNDLLGMGTKFELWLLPESWGNLALALGLDGECMVHFLKGAITDRLDSKNPATMFDIATYSFGADAAFP